ncbi:hypothetical protein JI666_10390 [Bacillus sp. NTK071]|uniref:hypothetical protein n=1 Tax=Bacillus sp. NTK071 TaxID=2802175 RepID=UPI001A8CCF13|nr:hypothetical protein [Bacillus sp. NTK071]MBN8209152.1 hypothetical protein [Bacillus sp. NTK071]
MYNDQYRLNWIPYYSYPPVYPFLRYPPIEVTRFQRSANTSCQLMSEARKLLEKIQQDTNFAHELKDAAQKNDHSHMEKVIRRAGVASSFHTAYTPDAIRIDLTAGNGDNCSELTVKLCW